MKPQEETGKIYYSKNQRRYIYTDLEVRCSKCDNQITNILLHATSWWKRDVFVKHYCMMCWDKIHAAGIVDHFEAMTLTDDLPSDATPVFFNPPELIQGKARTVFQAADDTDDGAQVIDHTRYAGRESFQGAQIGTPDMKAIERKDKQLSIKEAKKLLLRQQAAEIKGSRLLE